MTSRALKSIVLTGVLFVFGLSAPVSPARWLQDTAKSSSPIDQAPSVPLAPTGTLHLKDIVAHPEIEVIVPPLPIEQDGPTVARRLTERYADTRQDCGADNRPAFLCSGVLFRATIPGPYHTWNPNPSNTKGSVSFSWIRQDAKFRTIYTPRFSNGFIFYPSDEADRLDYTRMEILCVYPLDGSTDFRTDLGCGPLPAYDPVNSRPCAVLGITTGSAWVAHYRKSNLYTHICSFDVRTDTAHAATTFLQMGLAMAQLPERFQAITPGVSFTNELMVRTWAQNIHTTIPIEAFFYQAGTADGPANAKVDQRDFHQSAGRWVPIIRMTMPATVTQDARFDYLPDDQAISAMPPSAHIRWKGTSSVYETPAQPLVTDDPTVFRVPRSTAVATLGQSVEVSFVVAANGERVSPPLSLDVEAAAGILPEPMPAGDRTYARIDYPGMLATDRIWVSYEGNGIHDTPYPKRTAAFNAGISPSWLGAPDQVYYWVERGNRILFSPVVTSNSER